MPEPENLTRHQIECLNTLLQKMEGLTAHEREVFSSLNFSAEMLLIIFEYSFVMNGA